MSDAVKIVQPTKEDIIEAAKSYFILKKILAEEKADALMMHCLPGLRAPRKHVPPCMGYMSLRDEGIAMGCESDLDATITMMLLQELFGKPGFQHNPAYDTENDHYFCAHCTSASRMNGINQPAEPYELMSHCEAGWGTVPRVLFKEGQEVTIAKFLASQNPQLLLYSGVTIDCPPIPPTGGCRTNVRTTLNELENGTDLKGHHLIMIYGNHVKQLKQFCQLYDIEVVV
jgi:L-fucose isomerase-like protein